MRYLVIGVYEDNGQRFADTVEAENPAVALDGSNWIQGGWKNET